MYGAIQYSARLLSFMRKSKRSDIQVLSLHGCMKIMVMGNHHDRMRIRVFSRDSLA